MATPRPTGSSPMSAGVPRTLFASWIHQAIAGSGGFFRFECTFVGTSVRIKAEGTQHLLIDLEPAWLRIAG